MRPGQSLELLKELHILTRDGALNQDSRRKLKQVYHLFGFIEPLLQQLQADGRSDITLADHGAGKSYLGFILYDLFFKQHNCGTVYGIETRQELVEKSTALAQQLGFTRMQFLALSVQQATASSAPCPRALTSSPPCTLATPPPTTPLPLPCKKTRSIWYSFPAARPKLLPACGKTKPNNWHAPRYPNYGATRCTRAK